MRIEWTRRTGDEVEELSMGLVDAATSGQIASATEDSTDT